MEGLVRIMVNFGGRPLPRLAFVPSAGTVVGMGGMSSFCAVSGKVARYMGRARVNI